MSNDFFSTLEWEGNSFDMYKAILNSVPAIFRGNVKKQIRAWVRKNDIKTVTEDLVFMAVDDIAPAGLAESKIKPELTKMRSK